MKYRTFTNPRFFIVFSIIVAAALMRLLPHWPNFTPVAAMALFAGTYFERKQFAFAIPIAAMFLSDLVLGFTALMPAVYLSFVVTVVIGATIRKHISVRNVLLASFASTVIFFLITNFAAWLVFPFYPQNFLGLMESYMAGLVFFNDGSQGISFFVNDLLGTTFFSAVFYGVYYLAHMRYPVIDRSRF